MFQGHLKKQQPRHSLESHSFGPVARLAHSPLRDIAFLANATSGHFPPLALALALALAGQAGSVPEERDIRDCLKTNH